MVFTLTFVIHFAVYGIHHFKFDYTISDGILPNYFIYTTTTCTPSYPIYVLYSDLGDNKSPGQIMKSTMRSQTTVFLGESRRYQVRENGRKMFACVGISVVLHRQHLLRVPRRLFNLYSDSLACVRERG